MREIKFRAWHRNLLVMDQNVHLLERLSEIISRPETYELMQFTGLKDKEGKDIYEGDILKNERGDITTVEYDTEVVTNCGCCNEVKVVGYDFSDFAYPSSCVIIGNIHQPIK